MKPRKFLVIDCEGNRLRMFLYVRRWWKYQLSQRFIQTWTGAIKGTLLKGCEYLRANRLPIITALPDSQGIVKSRLPIDERNDRAVWLKLKYWAKTIFQCEAQLLYMDFERLSQLRAVAAPKKFVEAYLKPFREEGLKIKMLSLRQLGLERACRNVIAINKIVGVVEIRSTSIFFAVFSESIFCYLREDPIENALSFENVIEKIQQQYRFYISSVSTQLISEILLCGHHEKMYKLCEILTKRLDLPVRVMEESFIADGLAMSYGEARGY